MKDITISLGTVADAAALAEFAAHTFDETYSADNSPEDTRAHLSSTYGVRQQTAELVDPSVTTILARSNGELIAFAQIRWNTPPLCVTHAAAIELHRFYVDSKAHGSGLAYELMQAVHQAAHENDACHIWLGVWERNSRAIAFYKKVRFGDVGSKVYMVGPDKQDDRVLVASVCPQGQNSP